MINLRHSDFQYEFAVNGGDVKTSKWALIIPILFLLVIGAAYYFTNEIFISPEYSSYGWIGVFALFLMSTGLLFSTLSKGGLARFVVKIDLPNAEISAYDRLIGETLWVEEFFPDQIYISQISLNINGENYDYPALVYSETVLDQVEESVPYPERTILGYGEREELTNVLETMDNEINELY